MSAANLIDLRKGSVSNRHLVRVLYLHVSVLELLSREA